MARRLRLAPAFELLAGPELVLAVDRMDTAGVYLGMSNHREAFGGGARANARLRLAPRVTLSLVTALDYTPRALAPEFQLAEQGRDLYPSPEVRLFVGLGLGFRHLHGAVELDAYYQSVSGSMGGDDVHFTGATVTPAAGLTLSF